MFYQIQLSQLHSLFTTQKTFPNDYQLEYDKVVKFILEHSQFDPFTSFDSIYSSKTPLYQDTFEFIHKNGQNSERIVLADSTYTDTYQNNNIKLLKDLYTIAQFSTIYPKELTASLSIENNEDKIIKEKSLILSNSQSFYLYQAAIFRQESNLNIHIENIHPHYHKNNIFNEALFIKDFFEQFNIHLSPISSQEIYHLNSVKNNNSYSQFDSIFNWNDINLTDIVEEPFDPKKYIIAELKLLNNKGHKSTFEAFVTDNYLTEDLIQDHTFTINASNAHSYFPHFLIEAQFITLSEILDIFRKDSFLLTNMWIGRESYGKNVYNSYIHNVEEEAQKRTKHKLFDYLIYEHGFYNIDYYGLSQYFNQEEIQQLSTKASEQKPIHQFKHQNNYHNESLFSSRFEDIESAYQYFFEEQVISIEEDNKERLPVREKFQAYLFSPFSNLVEFLEQQKFVKWPPLQDFTLSQDELKQIYSIMLLTSDITMEALSKIPSSFFDYSKANPVEKDQILSNTHLFIYNYFSYIATKTQPTNPSKNLVQPFFNNIPHLNIKENILEVFSSYFNSSYGDSFNLNVAKEVFKQLLRDKPELLIDNDICSMFLKKNEHYFQCYFSDNDIENEKTRNLFFKLKDDNLILHAITDVKNLLTSFNCPREWLTNIDYLLSSKNISYSNLPIVNKIDFTSEEINQIFSLHSNNINFDKGATLIEHCNSLYTLLPVELKSIRKYATAYINQTLLINSKAQQPGSSHPVMVDEIPAHLFHLDSFCLDILNYNQHLISQIPDYHWKNTSFILQICDILDNNNYNLQKQIRYNIPPYIDNLFKHFDINSHYKDFFEAFSLNLKLENKTQDKNENSRSKKKKI